MNAWDSERILGYALALRQGKVYPQLDNSIRVHLARQFEELVDQAVALTVEADAFISHMVYRGSWPGERRDVERLIGKLRAVEQGATRAGRPPHPDGVAHDEYREEN